MNSENQTSNPATGQPTNAPLPTAPSPLADEAPLQSLPPGQSVLAPSKPLKEMTDTELEAWHNRLRDHKNHQTMQAHLAAVSTQKLAKKKPVVNVEDFF